MRSAFRLVITFSVAAGIRTSHSRRQQLVRIGRLRAREAVDRCRASPSVLQQRADVDAVRVVQRAVILADADDLVALLRTSASPRSSPHCRSPARSPGSRSGDMPRCFSAWSHTTATPRPVASRRPREPPRFTGLPVTTARHRLPHVHGVGVHDPRHRLLVGVHVRRGNVLLRPDELDQLRRVAARQPLQFALDILCGSQITPPFAPPNGMLTTAHFHVIQLASARTSSRRHVRRVADAALARPRARRVLHAIAGEDLDACRRPSPPECAR